MAAGEGKGGWGLTTALPLSPLFEIDTAVDLNLRRRMVDRFRTNIGPNIIETVLVFGGPRTLPFIMPLKVSSS